MDILDEMFGNLVVYVWIGDDDMRAVLLRSEDVDQAKMFTEYGDGEKADTWDRFLYLLEDEDIEYYDISDNLDVFENGRV
jgi:hypothetical protein